MEQKYPVTLKMVQRINFRYGQDNFPIEVLINPTSETSGQVYINIDNDHVSTYYWSHAGRPILDFLSTASTGYLIEKFFPKLEPTVCDSNFKNFLIHIKREYGEEIRNLYVNDQEGKFKQALRDAYDAVLNEELTEEFLYNDSDTFALFELLGVSWFETHLLPRLDNPKYMQMFEYFECIKKTIKANFSIIADHQETLCLNYA